MKIAFVVRNSRFASIFSVFFAATQIAAYAASADPYDPDDAVVEGRSIREAYDAVTGSNQSWSQSIELEVRDPEGRPVERAGVVSNGTEYFTDSQGTLKFSATSLTAPILIKKPGFKRIVLQPRRGAVRITLEPFYVKGVYLSGLNPQVKTVQSVIQLLETTELNGVVVDVKGDEGDILNGNLGPKFQAMKARGVYMIARIVTFKDNRAPRAHPEMALRDKSGALWLDESRSAYLDPRNEKAWDYVVSIAVKAALAGYDEVQFDYVRFPTGRNRDQIAGFSGSTADDRARAIGGFLKRARETLGPLGVFVAADIFGIAAHEHGDPSHIGQTPESLAPYLDYVCPMVYPSGYANQTDGIANPVNSPGAIVGKSVRRLQLRIAVDGQIRPWLQAFQDYSRRGGHYGAEQIRAQIDASEANGGRGFLLWNASNNYNLGGLKPKPTPLKVSPPTARK